MDQQICGCTIIRQTDYTIMIFISHSNTRLQHFMVVNQHGAAKSMSLSTYAKSMSLTSYKIMATNKYKKYVLINNANMC